mmetsp:Transcript_11561/g.17334  ORF Transcript_11561/g.17334 Transcript_11561/m.17334 type:complete len:851 (+) Transcript_11561:73-2625(+)
MQRKKEASELSKKLALIIARKPGCFLASSLLLCILLTVLAVAVGDIVITVDNTGWKSRGTLVAKRAMQADLLIEHQDDLYNDRFIQLPAEAAALYDSPWDYMQDNVVSGYISIGAHGRKIMDAGSDPSCDQEEWYDSFLTQLEKFEDRNNLVALWKGTSELSILEKDVLFDLCQAEKQTIESLGQNGFCTSCENNRCIAPFSLVTAIAIYLGLADDTTCEDFIAAYEPAQDQITQSLVTCANAMRTPGPCDLPLFGPHLVDADFGNEAGNTFLKFSSSYFYSSFSIDDSDAKRLFDINDTFGSSDGKRVTGVYDTNSDDFNFLAQDEYMLKDVGLAFVSVVVTTCAILLHTKSPFLTIMGSLQIIFSAPLAFCVYHFIAGVTFFPIINLIGFFVSSALGADDLFVAVDKWKNGRLAHPSKTTEEIAEMVFPDAAGAMLLTTSTTGVAFFATCLSPVPPIFTFALFCGLLVIFNYVLNCAMVFPALCIYDKWLREGKMGCFVKICGKKLQTVDDEISRNEDYVEDHPVESSKVPSFSNKIMSGFYGILHRFRKFILVIMVGAVVVSIYFAVSIKLPANSDVRMLPPLISFEQHHDWSRNLLSYELFTDLGTPVRFIFGAKASDTGDYRDPNTLSKLALDDTFDPSSTDAQEYLKGFCDRLNANDFVSVRPNYVCPINAFDNWLSDEAALDPSLQTPGYVDACKNGTDSLPMDEGFFHSCFTFWFRTVGEGLYTNRDVLDRDGIVKIIRINAITSVQSDNPYPVLQREWKKFEDWVKADSGMAPVGVNNFFHSASIWWWKDTNGQMIQTAIGASVIAICFSAVIVLLSSRSLRLTLFSGLCILYVLSAATAP